MCDVLGSIAIADEDSHLLDDSCKHQEFYSQLYSCGYNKQQNMAVNCDILYVIYILQIDLCVE